MKPYGPIDAAQDAAEIVEARLFDESEIDSSDRDDDAVGAAEDVLTEMLDDFIEDSVFFF